MKYVISKISIVFVFLSIMIIFSINIAFGDEHNSRQPISSKIKKVDIPIHLAKIDQQIMQFINNTENKTRNLEKNERLAVYVHIKPEFIKNIPKNLNIIAQSENIILAKLYSHQIQEISKLDNIRGITMPHMAIPKEHKVSEGVAYTFADQFQNNGFTGNGVTIAVIDRNFITSDSEITGNIISTSFESAFCEDMTCGVGAGNSHGTAVAEIIVDMAPDVNLRLYTIESSIGFNNAVQDAINNNVDIITASLGFPTIGGDGTTGHFRDGTSSVAKKINSAKTAGILSTMAAGNEGEGHWKGNYSPSSVAPTSLGLNSSYESVMNFRPAASGIQKACLPVTDIGDLYVLSWNDWDSSDQDYDFFLFNEALDTRFDHSLDVQNGIGLDPPIETISRHPSYPLSPSTLCLVVASWDSTENHLLHIDTEGNDVSSSELVRAGSIGTPADATGAFAVGAINQATDVLESFSSSGPTDDGRAKPEICGPDNTLSHQSGLNPFFGTSAATPHVAGAAALLLEQNPNLTATQIQNKLINEAKFNASYSVENLCGNNSGAVSLQEASSACPEIPSLGTWTITYDCELSSNSIVPGNVLVQDNSVLTIPSGIILDINFSQFNLTVKDGSGVLVKSGGRVE